VQCARPPVRLVGEQAGIYAAFVLGGPPARLSTPADCHIVPAAGQLNDAVFGSDLGYAEASELAQRALDSGFQGTRVERTDCDAFRVVVTGVPDDPAVQREFRRETAGVGFDVSFAPGLSLQTYLQPLISAARYEEFKRLARARSYEFESYGATPPEGVNDPTFNLKSLRGNAVLRWEYRPGSVLYLVWTQERAPDPEWGMGELRFGPSTRRLLDAQASDIFLVKATYYFHL
jgi:hypothetical protein